MPVSLFQGMQEYPVVWLEDSLENRVERILRDYVVDLCAEFVAIHGEEAGVESFGQRLRESLDNIRKRLGASGTSASRQSWMPPWRGRRAAGTSNRTGPGSRNC